MYIYPSSPESTTFLQCEELAAIKIQAGFRGYRVRQQLHRQNKPGNGYLTKRQAHSNSFKRKQQRQQERAHLEMDSQHKNNVNNDRSGQHDTLADAEVRAMEDRCATKIQAGVRGFLVRKKQKIATDAAVKIQAGFRGFKVRKESRKLQEQ